jgi:hypothetical protein
MPELGTSGSAGGPLIASYDKLYPGTKAETLDTDKSSSTVRQSAPYPDRRAQNAREENRRSCPSAAL